MSDKSKIRRRFRCPKCGSLDIIKWGVRNGQQRHKCNNCNASFSARRKDISKSNRLPWFRKWVLGKMTVSEISELSGYSSRQLHRWFEEYLEEYPTWNINTSVPIFLLIDGTYYSDDHCLIVYRAENLKRTVFYRFARLEDDDEIASDLMTIRDLGYKVVGITTDGGDNIIRATKFVYPDVPRQRCVVHVQRECLALITLRPRSQEGTTLKNIVSKLSEIKTANDKLWWIKMYDKWVEDNEEYVCEKGVLANGQTYYIRNDLRKAYVHLRRAVPNLFLYLDNPGLPETTNAIESFFGHVKDQLRLHRGLSERRIDNFIKWYLFFNDEKKSLQQAPPPEYMGSGGCISSAAESSPQVLSQRLGTAMERVKK